MKSHLITIVSAAGIWTSLALPSNAETYDLTVLNPLATAIGSNRTTVTGINDSGQVVGWSNVNGQDHAVIWNGSNVTDLGTLGGMGSYAYGISNSGVVVGESGDSSGGHAVTWTSGTISLLGPPGSSANGINNVGQVIGTSLLPSTINATVWNAGVPTALSFPAGSNSTVSQGLTINNSGIATGFISGFGSLVWNSGVPSRLNDLGGNNSRTFAINDAGIIAGWAAIAGGDERSVVWNNSTTPTDLGMLPGAIYAEAHGINNAGVVVGFSGNAPYATLWENGEIIDLNTLLSPSGLGWHLTEAIGINNLGQIIGQGFFDGQYESFLLTPCDPCIAVPLPAAAVPELSTWAMLLIGFVGIGFAGYRRRQGMAA